jgi:acyl phosphate:glycerol-3-phosphate acyltransferase
VPVLCYISIAVAAYLLGSIPFGYLAAKAKGIDIRSVGSGNIGATNAMRVLGKPAGISVLLLDVLKGLAAVAWVTPAIYNWIEPHYFGLAPGFAAAAVAVQMKFKVIAGVCAVLGHNYTCWLKFKGGKGIATTAGVYLALAPWALLVALAVFIVALLASRIVSVASMSAAVALPVTVWIMTPQNVFLGVVTTALGALAIYKHKSNIQRLMAGTENRFGKKKSTEVTK